MTNVAIHRVFCTYKTLADGSKRKYWYHRPSRTRLPGEKGSPEWMRALVAAETSPKPKSDTFSALVEQYMRSEEFKCNEKKKRPKSENTIREYYRILDVLDKRFGAMPVRALHSLKATPIFKNYHREIAATTPREADNRISVLSNVLKLAVMNGLIPRNPVSKLPRAYGSDRSHIIHTKEAITEFMATAPIELQQVMILALHTGQRYGDLIRLRWADFDGKFIRFVQSKTKMRMVIAASKTLAEMLENMPRRSEFILTRANGMPWHTAKSDKELSKQWRHHMRKIGLHPADPSKLTKEEKSKLLHFHDLRGTAVTLFAAAGCTVPQICAITGHDLETAGAILKIYLANSELLSESAIARFDDSQMTSFANQLQTTEHNKEG